MLWLPGGVLTVPAMFIAGTAASAHCVLMCGSFSVHQARTSSRLAAGSAMTLLYAGRACGYALMGAISGGFGQAVLQALPAARLGFALQLASALILLGTGIWMSTRRLAPSPVCCSTPRFPFMNQLPAPLLPLTRGLAWALIPCGLLYAVLGMAAFSGNALQGALLTTAYALGGTPALAAVGWRFRRRKTSLAGRPAAAQWMIAFALASIAGLLWFGVGAELPWCSAPH